MHIHMSLHSILQSISQTPHKLKKRALATWTPDQELHQLRLRSGANMKRKLRWFDLVSLGVGGMLGAGVLVTTGFVTRSVTGPACFISYMVAGLTAIVSSLCYTEFAVEIPVAGGAFSYLRVTFGEFAGYYGGVNMLMEYVLSNAAVARSFTEYLSSATGRDDPNAWRISAVRLADGYNRLDFIAVVLIALLTLCLCLGTKESSVLNMIMTIFHIVLFAFVVVAGFYNGRIENLTEPGGLAPFGVEGILDGAAIVYFSYIGYDAVSTVAEEIQSPSTSLPVGIVGPVIIVSGLYCLMALALSSMFPYDKIPENASFSSAFEKTMGWRWAGNVVGVGASLGIVASLLVAMLGQARYLCVIGRARLAPLWLAKVHPSTGTPVNATIFLGICTATIALFTDLDVVLEMISMGTLLVFYMVANALIYHRHVDTASPRGRLPTLLFLASLSSTSLASSLSWHLISHHYHKWAFTSLFVATSVAVTAFFQCAVPAVHRPLAWSMPLVPWPATTSIFLNMFLMTTLRRRAFVRFGVWSGVVVIMYVVYGVHALTMLRRLRQYWQGRWQTKRALQKLWSGRLRWRFKSK